LRQDDDDFDLGSLHDLELGEEDAELYNPPDQPRPKGDHEPIPSTTPTIQIEHSNASTDSFE